MQNYSISYDVYELEESSVEQETGNWVYDQRETKTIYLGDILKYIASFNTKEEAIAYILKDEYSRTKYTILETLQSTY
jgi:hypothetical protein